MIILHPISTHLDVGFFIYVNVFYSSHFFISASPATLGCGFSSCIFYNIDGRLMFESTPNRNTGPLSEGQPLSYYSSHNRPSRGYSCSPAFDSALGRSERRMSDEELSNKFGGHRPSYGQSVSEDSRNKHPDRSPHWDHTGSVK